MSAVLIIICLVAALFVAAFLWGFLRILDRKKDARELIMATAKDELPALISECVCVFSEKLGKKLSLDDPETAAHILDNALTRNHQMTTVTAFERPGHKGWFVKPMGAFLGELIRTNAGGRWTESEEGGLAVVLGNEPDTVILHPFDKIEKQRMFGDPGDLTAYVKVAVAGPASFLPPKD